MRVPKREIALRTAKTTGQRQNSPGKSIEQAYCGRRRRILPTEGPFLCMRQTYTVLGRGCETANSRRVRETHHENSNRCVARTHPFEASIDIASARVSCVGYKNVAT
jgi:hypothetical protein